MKTAAQTIAELNLDELSKLQNGDNITLKIEGEILDLTSEDV